MIFHNDIGVLVTMNELNQGVLPPIYFNTFSNQVFVSQVSVEKNAIKRDRLAPL